MDWEVYPLSALSKSIMVGIASAATHAYRATGIPLFRNQNIKADHLDDRDLLFISPEYEAVFKNKRLRGGDLVTARTGYPGVTAIVPLTYENAQSFTTLITRPRKSAIDSRYLCIFINSEIGQSFFTKSQIGGAQKNVNAGTLRQMPIVTPLAHEQRAIAGALTDVDALLGALEQLIAKKRDLKQAAMQQLLTAQTRLTGFSGGWTLQTLGDVVAQFVGGGTPSRSDSRYWGGTVPWMTVKDFTSFRSDNTQESITRLGLKNSASHLIPAGTLITSTRMALGKAVIYTVDVAINQDLKALFLRPELSVHFLHCWFDHHQDVINALGSGSTVMGISLSELKAVPILIPLLSEQNAMAAVLNDMDAELLTLEQRLTKTRHLKQGMMQELLTGRIRLLVSEENRA